MKMIDIIKSYKFPIKFYSDKLTPSNWILMKSYDQVNDVYNMENTISGEYTLSRSLIYRFGSEEFIILSHGGLKNNNQQYNVSAGFTTYTPTTTRRSGYCPKMRYKN